MKNRTVKFVPGPNGPMLDCRAEVIAKVSAHVQAAITCEPPIEIFDLIPEVNRMFDLTDNEWAAFLFEMGMRHGTVAANTGIAQALRQYADALAPPVVKTTTPKAEPSRITIVGRPNGVRV